MMGPGHHSHGSPQQSAPISINSANQNNTEIKKRKAELDAAVPKQRPALAAKAASLLGGALVFSLWFAAGMNYDGSVADYLKASVKNFKFDTSLFDVFLITLFINMFVFLLYSNVPKFKTNGSFRMLALALPGGALVYYFVKLGIMVANDLSNVLGGRAFAAAILSMAIIFTFIELVPFFVIKGLLHELDYYTALKDATKAEEDEKSEGDDKKKEAKSASLKRLLMLIKYEWRILTIGMMALFVSSMTNLVMPYIFGMMVDALASETNAEELLAQSVITLLVVFAIGALFGFIRSWTFTLAGHRIVARLRRQVFVAVIEQEIGFFDQERTGELTSRLTSDCQVVQNAVTVNVSMLVRYLVQIIGSITILIILSWQLSLIMFSIVPVVAIGAVIYGRFVQEKQKQFQDALAGATTVAEEVISNIRVVRSFSKEKYSQELYGDAIFKSYDIGRIISFAYGVFNGVFAFIPTAAIVLILWYGGLLVINGDMTTGLLTSFLFYTLSVAMAFAFLSALFGDFMAAVGASERIFHLIDRKPSIPVAGGKIIESLQGNVVFEDVHFSYPTRPEVTVLSDVNLKLSPGTVLALVGPSGGGKSTIVGLLERFYDTTSGTVYIDGVNIRELDPEWLRKHIALVSQEPVLFASTIEENICYGVDREVNLEEIEAAAKAANAHQFIMEFPGGYKTAVGERGVRLSGGQKQRVAIARALLMNPKILLLDEATSALDAESEYLVQEAIDRAMQNRTVLVIAHRLSTIKNADQIAVLSGGKIIECGPHDELIEKDGLYKKLVNRQLQGHSLDEAFKELEKEEKKSSSTTATPQPQSQSSVDSPTADTTDQDKNQEQE